MGLDSIELLMEVETYFRIQVPDPEAEKAHTVQALVDTVARHLKVIESSTELRDNVFERVQKAIWKLELSDKSVELTDNILQYLPSDNRDIWKAFENELQLDVPRLDSINKVAKRVIDNIRSVLNWAPMYDQELISVEQFIAAICAHNLDELVDKDNIKSTYEIYIAVTAITVNKIGVDYYEVAPEKSFTNDLGVD